MNQFQLCTEDSISDRIRESSTGHSLPPGDRGLARRMSAEGAGKEPAVDIDKFAQIRGIVARSACPCCPHLAVARAKSAS
jgi:hypothetical protein